MCTVTFIARKRGYALGMNRDEKLARPKGLKPALRRMNKRAVLAPSETGGGTWVAVNDHRVTFALINWYSVARRVPAEAVSRGIVVNRAILADSPDAAQAALEELPLSQINPFRLIGVFPDASEVVEWRWDLKRFTRKRCPWRTQQWISSGFDEPEAQRIRGATFRRLSKLRSAGTISWLRRLHSSHSPACGPFSTCMHRADAATVSYTEICVRGTRVNMRHLNDALCNLPGRRGTPNSCVMHSAPSDGQNQPCAFEPMVAGTAIGIAKKRLNVPCENILSAIFRNFGRVSRPRVQTFLKLATPLAFYRRRPFVRIS